MDLNVLLFRTDVLNYPDGQAGISLTQSF